MNNTRLTFLVLHSTLLAAGLGLAVWALAVSWVSYGSESIAQTVRRGGAGSAALLVSALFTFVLLVRGFRNFAPLFFAISYGLVAATTDIALAGYMKAWAPATREEARRANMVALTAAAILTAVVVAAAWLSSRRAPLRPTN